MMSAWVGDTQVCDHPALLSENATKLVTSGGQRLAKKQAGGGARLGGFIVPDDESAGSEASWSRSGSEEEEEEEVSMAGRALHISQIVADCMQDAGSRCLWSGAVVVPTSSGNICRLHAQCRC